MKRVLLILPIILDVILLFIWQNSYSEKSESLLLYGIYPLFFTLICWGIAAVLVKLDNQKLN